jgi:epoxyqueuosine reductase
MGHHIFGCEMWQDVCPWNVGYQRSENLLEQKAAHRAATTGAAEFQPRPDLVHPPLEWFAQMTREQFNDVFRHSPVKRAKYEGIRRNVAVAMGNSGSARFIPDLEKMAQDADANVAEHARWALERLKNSCR